MENGVAVTKILEEFKVWCKGKGWVEVSVEIYLNDDKELSDFLLKKDIDVNFIESKKAINPLFKKLGIKNLSSVKGRPITRRKDGEVSRGREDKIKKIVPYLISYINKFSSEHSETLNNRGIFHNMKKLKLRLADIAIPLEIFGIEQEKRACYIPEGNILYLVEDDPVYIAEGLNEMCKIRGSDRDITDFVIKWFEKSEEEIKEEFEKRGIEHPGEYLLKLPGKKPRRIEYYFSQVKELFKKREFDIAETHLAEIENLTGSKTCLKRCKTWREKIKQVQKDMKVTQKEFEYRPVERAKKGKSEREEPDTSGDLKGLQAEGRKRKKPREMAKSGKATEYEAIGIIKQWVNELGFKGLKEFEGKDLLAEDVSEVKVGKTVKINGKKVKKVCECDVLVISEDGTIEQFVEVKSKDEDTNGPIRLPQSEWEGIQKYPDNYFIYYVSNVGKRGKEPVSIKIIKYHKEPKYLETGEPEELTPTSLEYVFDYNEWGKAVWLGREYKIK